MVKIKRNVLFIGRGNAARSVMAEALINELGEGAFIGFSAGSDPQAHVDSKVAEYLETKGLNIGEHAPRPWTDFEAGKKYTKPDIVITLSETAAGSMCPEWPGFPFRAFWETPDPLKGQASLDETYDLMQKRVQYLVDIPFLGRKRAALNRWVELVGHID